MDKAKYIVSDILYNKKMYSKIKANNMLREYSFDL